MEPHTQMQISVILRILEWLLPIYRGNSLLKAVLVKSFLILVALCKTKLNLVH